MSLESAKAFIEKMKTDRDFQKKVIQCKNNEERKAFVVKEGFDFSVEDLKSCTGELSDDELSGVVGSGCYDFPYTCSCGDWKEYL